MTTSQQYAVPAYVAGGIIIFIIIFYLIRRCCCRNSKRITITTDKLVVITGCDSGLGYSFALKCRELGIPVVAGCLSLESDGAKQLSSLTHVLQLDVTKSESVRSFVNDVHQIIEQDNMQLHALVNNAGILICGEFEWQTENQIVQQVKVNQLGTYVVTKSLLPLLRHHEGRLINITSHTAEQGLPMFSLYSSTKAAVEIWTDALRMEQKKYGVKVITLNPGSFTGQSNLMVNQPYHTALMKEEMTTGDWEFHSKYFSEVNKSSPDEKPTQSLKIITDDQLYKKFFAALTDEKPQSKYVIQTWKFRLYNALFKMSPVSLRDKLVMRFLNLPKYKPHH